MWRLRGLRKPQGEARGASPLERELAQQIMLCGLPVPEREYAFAAGRRWRADFAWPAASLLCEVEGGIWTDGRHVRGSGFAADTQKYNTAVALGWRVLRVTAEQIRSGLALNWIEQCLSGRSSGHMSDDR